MSSQIINLNEYHRLVIDERADGTLDVMFQELCSGMWRKIKSETYADMDCVICEYDL